MNRIDEWDEWFKLTADDEARKAWRAARAITSKENELLAWAHIIEMNRIDRATRNPTDT